MSNIVISEDWPRVSDILQELDYVEGVEFMTEKGRKRGNTVHTLTQLYDEGDLDRSSVDPRLSVYFDGWKDFIADNDVEFTAIERPVMHPLLRYRGTPDRIGTLSGEPYIFEVKTGGTAKWHRLQLMAYRMTQNVHPMGRCVIYLSGKSYKMVCFDKEREDEKAWTAAVNTYYWRKANGYRRKDRSQRS